MCIMKGKKIMKYLKIDKSKGYYYNEKNEYIEIDKIGSEDIYYLLNKAINSDDFDMDQYDETILHHEVHRIIYNEIYNKMQNFIKQKESILFEVNSLYDEAKRKYIKVQTTK